MFSTHLLLEVRWGPCLLDIAFKAMYNLRPSQVSRPNCFQKQVGRGTCLSQTRLCWGGLSLLRSQVFKLSACCWTSPFIFWTFVFILATSLQGFGFPKIVQKPPGAIVWGSLRRMRLFWGCCEGRLSYLSYIAFFVSYTHTCYTTNAKLTREKCLWSKVLWNICFCNFFFCKIVIIISISASISLNGGNYERCKHQGWKMTSPSVWAGVPFTV